MAKATKTRKRSRPTIYSDQLAKAICKRLAEGESLRAICGDEGMPVKSTVLGWLFDGAHDDFSDQYTRARQAQAETRADEVIDLADDTTDDWVTGENGKRIVDHEHISRSRLRVDTRKWVASKLLPKVYGDKLQHTGEGGGPIVLGLSAALTEALMKARNHEQRIGGDED